MILKMPDPVPGTMFISTIFAPQPASSLGPPASVKLAACFLLLGIRAICRGDAGDLNHDEGHTDDYPDVK